MMPLMYAIIGTGCYNAQIIQNFMIQESLENRNCLGHTAFDIFGEIPKTPHNLICSLVFNAGVTCTVYIKMPQIEL